MLCDSGLLQQLQRYAQSPAGQPMCIYGDAAYPLRVQLQAFFRNVVLTPQMQAFNSSMSSVKSCVEWLFGDIVNYFKFIDFKKNLKIELSGIGKLYIVCAVLQNAVTCLYGNLTSKIFDLATPTLQDYFAYKTHLNERTINGFYCCYHTCKQHRTQKGIPSQNAIKLFKVNKLSTCQVVT